MVQCVEDFDLRALWPQAREREDESGACFLWRLRTRIRQADHLAQRNDAPRAAVALDEHLHVGRLQVGGTHQCIQPDYGGRQSVASAEVKSRTRGCRRWHGASDAHFVIAQLVAVQDDALRLVPAALIELSR